MNNICIAIDGHSSSGKSTLAKDIARTLNYAFVDTGAMYRAVTLYFMENNISVENHDAVLDSLNKINIQFKNIEGKNTCFLNDKNVESEIRSMDVSSKVSGVATLQAVRTKLVEYQRQMGATQNIVMDGRDIGSVVFPDARVKFFVTADLKTRAERRYHELVKKGKEVTFEEIFENLKERDHTDTTREISPLVHVEDALLIDNTNLSIAEQKQKALDYIESRK